MVNFVNIIFILWGTYLFFFSLVGAEGNLELLSERNYSCPYKFLPKQKLCDGINAFHDICKSFIGAVLALDGIVHFRGDYGDLLLKAQSIVACLIFVDVIVSQFLYRKKGLFSLMTDIKTQWHTEKKITEEHDDEVRYYRQAKNIGEIIKYDAIFLSIIAVSLVI